MSQVFACGDSHSTKPREALLLLRFKRPKETCISIQKQRALIALTFSGLALCVFKTHALCWYESLPTATKERRKHLHNSSTYLTSKFEVCAAVVEMLASQRSEYMEAITKSLKTYRSFVAVGSDSYLCEGKDRQGKNMYGEALTLYQHRAWVLNTHNAKPENVNAIKALCF
ncbi:hypothetical protein JB92DRAFT_3108010 [Gautieria morchelliformis]|nr:hypothetical protein JB92DRAFT_3108010 [Gautieria morchelliformis]